MEAHRRPLSRSFYARDTLEVARALIGCRLVHLVGDEVRSGVIVETEAYHGRDDLASHAWRGVTPRTRVMYGPPGHAYVYLVYGIHHCVNLVTMDEGFPAAVLIRALEPDPGLGSANTTGPGRLARALAITRGQDGLDVTRPPLLVEPGDTPPRTVATSPRIGVDYAGACAAWPRRFYDPDSRWVSGPRRRAPAPASAARSAAPRRRRR